MRVSKSWKAIAVTGGMALMLAAGSVMGQDAKPQVDAKALQEALEKHKGASGATPPKNPNDLPPLDPAKPTARISFDKAGIDFGAISDETNVTGTFTFTNVGNATLEINNTAGSCGCTVPALSKRSYAPGESGTITVTYNPHNRKGPQTTTVSVMSNDPLQPVVSLNVQSLVKQVIGMEPAVVNFGQIEKGKPQTRRVMVTSRKQDLRVTDFGISQPSVKAVMGEPIEMQLDGDTVWQTPVDVTIGGGTDVGTMQGQVTIRTTNPGKQLNLMCMAEIVGDVQLNPVRLQVGGLNPEQPISTAVVISSRNGKIFNIVGYEEAPGAGSPLFKLNLVRDPNANPPRWTLQVVGNAPAAPGAFRGDILIRTDIPDEPTLKVPYFGFVRNQPGTQAGAPRMNPAGAPQPAPKQPATKTPSQNPAWQNNPSPLIVPD